MQPDDIDRHIGNNMRNLRMEAGLSQQQVAALFDLSYQQIQKYEKGRSRVPARMLAVLRGIYNVPFEAFFAGLEPDGPRPRDPLDASICRRVAGIADGVLKRKIDRIIGILAA